MHKSNPNIILASTSPRRRELITFLRLPISFTAADVDESPLQKESPIELVRRLSCAKVEIEENILSNPKSIVVAADTVVSLDDVILGKPSDTIDAVRMLTMLRARTHQVYSGLSIAHGEKIRTLVAMTRVWMRDYSDSEITAYVASGDPLDKAAAYAIQNNGFHPVARIEGCYANVMGLPLCHLHGALREFGLEVNEPDGACQLYLNIRCPVAKQILNHKK